MKVLSNILWAIDLANNHSDSIKKIRMISDQFGNELVLLHVLPGHLKGASGEKKIVKSVQFEIKNKIVSQLKLAEDFEVKIRVEFGNVADQINRVAKEEKVNLVLLNKGKTNNLGANGLSIFRKIQKPVAVISETKVLDPTHVVCPVDNSKASAVALKSAILHARKFDAKLSVVSVFEPITSTSPRLMRMGYDVERENKYHYRTFKKELRAFLKNFDFSNVQAEAYILKGQPDSEITKFCADASVLYVGSGGKSAIQRALQGSVSENVISNVECNIVAVKNEDVFKLRIPEGLENIDKHFNRGNELRKLGFLREAIMQYKAALILNELHLPSLQALAEVYELIQENDQAGYYKELAQIIITKMNYRKIEEEVRNNFRSVS
ncbi:universal stress protein [uncultured Draconibacterium sp.]|uniref:universal stress protein n=1 Tax=uncultured Draconibacterium sp. TaxID=1573823 RepID=UPI002AA8A45D|nr:universal stress protein [uncultured Draconibacterium sp.]